MCIEYALAGVITFGLVIAIAVLLVEFSKLDKSNDAMYKDLVQKEDIIREQWGTIEELEQELAKKNSLISILKVEIEEKENKK